MKKKLYIVTTLFLAVSFVVFILSITRAKNPKCDITCLVLDNGDMPEGWTKKWDILPPVLDPLGSQQAYSTVLLNGDEEVGHAVYRYPDRWSATFYMWFQREIFFPSMGWKWSELGEANNLPLNADQVQIECSRSNFQYLGEGCTAVLRYGPYISVFSASVQEGVMSAEEFKEIIFKIDEQFRSCQE